MPRYGLTWSIFCFVKHLYLYSQKCAYLNLVCKINFFACYLSLPEPVYIISFFEHDKRNKFLLKTVWFMRLMSLFLFSFLFLIYWIPWVQRLSEFYWCLRYVQFKALRSKLPISQSLYSNVKSVCSVFLALYLGMSTWLILGKS